MNIDSHSEISAEREKKCPVNRLTMKSHFFLGQGLLDSAKVKEKQIATQWTPHRFASKWKEDSEVISHEEMWMNSKLMVIIELWMLMPRWEARGESKAIRRSKDGPFNEKIIFGRFPSSSLPNAPNRLSYFGPFLPVPHTAVVSQVIVVNYWNGLENTSWKRK